MKPNEFAKYVARDGSCPHCGIDDNTLVPQHRAGRQMGGKNNKAARPSNILVMCSYANGQLESNATFARLGREYGWKLTQGEDSSTVPVFHSGRWYLLDDEFGRTEVEKIHEEH